MFKRYQIIGNPRTAVDYFYRWGADELVFLDITPKGEFNLERKDQYYERCQNFVEFLSDVSTFCFIPMTAGGGIKSLEDIHARLKAGADKVAVNTHCLESPPFIKESSGVFGSQCIVVSMDVKINESGKYEVFKDSGKVATGLDPVDWACEVESLGAGEIFLNSIDRDGIQEGYDIELIKNVSLAVKIPVIACGGVGKWQDLVDGLTIGHASAVAAANIFHFTDQSIMKAKKHIRETGIPEIIPR